MENAIRRGLFLFAIWLAHHPACGLGSEAVPAPGAHGLAWGVVFRSAPAAALPVVYTPEDFECLEGCSVQTRRGRVVLDLDAGPRGGKAGLVFGGDTARYDVAVSHLGRQGGEASLRLAVNGAEVAKWMLADNQKASKTAEGFRKKWARGVDIQRGSWIVLELADVGGQPCSVSEMAFAPQGPFEGEALPEAKLVRPATLRVYETPDRRRGGRGMLEKFISERLARVADERDRELASLRTPDQWRERQRRARARLEQFFGRFGPKSPLNPRIAGKLDRPDYVIEKLIFESRPGYYCTANVYAPKRRKFPLPGVLFTCGHSAEGKAYHLYHECCLGLVLKGYVVLALDPTGQGERSEYFDPATGEHLVPLTVSQHHYLARPSWLVGRTLAGYRTWDGVRAVDYLAARPEVDPERIAVTGNSGGGIMALLITAVDERVKVCAAAHPGGSMEQTFLTGRWIPQCEILSLIPPRACLFIVGRDSGEEAGHRQKMDDMLRFYDGLGAKRDRCQLVLVDGVHNMEKPKRVAAYAWLNRWFQKEEEGSDEPPLNPETVEALRCTPTGYTVRDLRSETGQTLNAKLAELLRPPRQAPRDAQSFEAVREELKRTIAARIGWKLPAQRGSPASTAVGSFEADDFAAEKLELESEPGVRVPALLLKPRKPSAEGPVVVHAAELGKPTCATRPSTALDLARRGYTVLSVDVRGAGETDPRARSALPPLTQYDARQFQFDCSAVQAAQFGTTMLAMQASDVIRAVDYLASRDDLAQRPIVLVGEGLGGVWMLAAAAFDPRPAGVVCIRTTPSYRLIVDSQYYSTRDYFWVPGALQDFDPPDLIALVAPRSTVLLDPANALCQPLEEARCRELCAWPSAVYRTLAATGRFRIQRTEKDAAAEIAAALKQIAEESTNRRQTRRSKQGP